MKLHHCTGIVGTDNMSPHDKARLWPVYLASDVDEFKAAVGSNTQLLHNRIAALELSAQQCAHERDCAVERVAGLEKALREAIESIEDWAGYASEYFQEKHDLKGELARLNSALMERS